MKLDACNVLLLLVLHKSMVSSRCSNFQVAGRGGFSLFTFGAHQEIDAVSSHERAYLATACS